MSREHQETEARIERAREVIRLCGGAAAVAEITGRALSRVHSWTYTRDRHGTDGFIPPVCQEALLRHARAEGIDLTPDHFFPPFGATADDQGAAA